MVNDVVADSINRIKVGYFIRSKSVSLFFSVFLGRILDCLFFEGFLSGISLFGFFFLVDLRYYLGRPACFGIWRVSSLSRRIYLSSTELKSLALKNVSLCVSTSLGIYFNFRLSLFSINIGGEVLLGVR